MPDGPFLAVASGADPLRSFASLRMTMGKRDEPTWRVATSFRGWGSGLVGESRETKAVEQSKWRAGSCFCSL